MSIEKRVFDVWLAAVGLTLLWPLLLGVAVLIRLSDGGPVFFRQARVGHKGRLFRIWKFRTMVPDAAAHGIPLTVGDDARVTRVGTWLRRLKLDELPQLLNVLMGQMSFVGPRPELPCYVAHYTGTERRVLDLVPGMTGEASLRFRNESEVLAQAPDPERAFVEAILPEKVRLNLAYGERATLWTDLRLIAITVRELLSPTRDGREIASFNATMSYSGVGGATSHRAGTLQDGQLENRDDR